MTGRPHLRLVTAEPAPAARPLDPDRRGYVVAYWPGERNPCPGCSRMNWLVGRLMAECAFCATALPLAGEGPRHG